MNQILIYSFVVFIIIRILSVLISKKNEKKLKNNGAVEYGIINTKILALLHTVFYLSCFIEGYIGKTQINTTSIVGYCLYLFSIIILSYVILTLSPIWTVKLIIAKDHSLVKNKIFKLVKHPNYFLNIVPELIGISLIFQAFNTLIVLFPIYMIPLIIRIRNEEKVMKEIFPEY